MVDWERSRRDQVGLPGLDLAGMDREQVTGSARTVQRSPRLLELDPLHPIGGQDRDLHALQVVSHLSSSTCRHSGFVVGDQRAIPPGSQMPPRSHKRKLARARVAPELANALKLLR